MTLATPADRGLRYKTPWFGKQNWREVPPEVQELIQSADTYADWTMGGAEVPYLQAARGALVIGNDRALTAYYFACAGMMCELKPESTRAELTRLFQLPNRPRPGYVFENRPPGITTAAALMIDELCQAWSTTPWMLGIIGRVIAKHWTENRRRWATEPTTSMAALRRALVDEALECIRSTQLIAEAGGRVHLMNLDALQAISKLRPSGGKRVCFVDPAWPWAPQYAQEGENPYRFLTYDVSAILAQKPIPEIPYFWETGGAEEADLIMEDVVSWVWSAFNHDWDYFIVSTQSTNFPDPLEVVAPRLASTFGNAHVYHVDTVGGNDGIKYKDYFIVVENERTK